MKHFVETATLWLEYTLLQFNAAQFIVDVVWFCVLSLALGAALAGARTFFYNVPFSIGGHSPFEGSALLVGFCLLLEGYYVWTRQRQRR
jgi:hypothetical protein